MKHKVLGITMALLATLSCVKEKEHELQPEQGEERFAEFDPVVRFGLDTYMGTGEPVTKTTYAGESETVVVFDEATAKKVRYERINWNVWQETPNPADPVNKPDTIRVLAEENFTKNKKTFVDYSPVEIPGVTNRSGSKDSAADARPVGGDENDNLYWELSDKPRYFYAVYPSPQRTSSGYKPSMSVSGPDGSHTVTVQGSIPREQPYIKKEKNGRVVEYMPNMADAYMYAAAKIPSADAGYVKVPLRFKPLFSAIKLIVSANANDDGSGVGAKKYRLKRVDLRTDLFYDDLNQGDPTRVNKPKNGTALNGDFEATFTTDNPGSADNKPEYTGDFTVTSCPVPSTEADNDYKRLTINIKDGEREWLSDVDTVKLTFLALPIEQKVMTVVYTFEVNDGSGDPLKDEHGNPVEVTRYLALQTRTREEGGKVYRNEFEDKEEYWYSLPAAHKLYVKSNVPEILYYFDVQAQGNFPRTWNSGDDIKDGTHYYSDDFYSVQSYRDSSGVKQSMKWKVTGYKNPGDAKFEMGNRPDWLRLRGDDGTWDPDLEIPDLVNHGWDAGGDPWDGPWGAGTPMENGDFSTSSTFVSHARNYIKGTSFVSYVSAAKANEEGYSRNESLDSDGKPDVFENNRDWDVPVSYLCRDLDGKYYYQEDHNHTPSAGWKGLKGEAYAYDLSSHDIYGNLIVDKNGDLGTTANCYVVSAPGWYRFPAVYGNSLKNGGDNIKAYNKGGTESAGIMGAFLDHNANGIGSPEIPGIDDVDVLWDDANHMVAPSTTVSTRADRKPFYHKDPSETYGYIYFYVDDIAQGNALLVAKSGDTIVWSWQIWAVTKPGTFLRTVGLESNKKDRNGADNLYQSIYGTNYFWQKTDLGQHGKESAKVDPRYCDVEFTQYFRGKVVKKVVVRFLQSGVQDDRDGPIFYQWGRKDPFPRDRIGVANGASGITVENTHQTIRNPNIFYGGTFHNVANGKRYDNLWNVNITTAPSTPKSDGTATGSLDRKVEKTIYDPSPPGFHMANLYSLSGFNPISPIYETKIPRADANKVAKNARPTQTYYKGRRYYDFYAEYDESAEYRRKLTGETIRFYCLGRINAAGFDNPSGDNTDQAYYFFSEPGTWIENTAFYGRSLWIGGDAVGTGQWQIYPVAGTADLAKWQRNHALPVRPMAEGTQPDKQFGGTNMNPPSNQNPF